ncbi:MAG: SAM-dependent methyltransferase [Gammaproteobacteria bacterium]|nr:MAG: SAM-dependent methyltransferase [Gammaproteobacteria bacterium]
MTQKTSTLLSQNRQFYDGLWGGSQLITAEQFNTWPLVSGLCTTHERRLEIAPGLRPRLPIAGTQFVDISAQALAKLAAQGGHVTLASISELPFADGRFDLVCALDILEHVEDDHGALAEIARVTAPGATLLLSSPFHQSWWTPFDAMVGHCRRYEPSTLIGLLEQHGFTVMQSAGFGMKPKSDFWTNLGMWFLQHQPERAFWWYNRVMPFVLKRQPPLQLREGLIETDNIAEALLVCRKQA